MMNDYHLRGKVNNYFIIKNNAHSVGGGVN